MFAEDISGAMKIVHGTAVASGIRVEGYGEWLATSAPQLKISVNKNERSLSMSCIEWHDCSVCSLLVFLLQDPCADFSSMFATLKLRS